MIIYRFAEDLMISEDPMSSEVLISSNNMLPKRKRKKGPKIPQYEQYSYPQNQNMQQYIELNEWIVRQWPGKPGFNSRSSHTKD